MLPSHPSLCYSGREVPVLKEAVYWPAARLLMQRHMLRFGITYNWLVMRADDAARNMIEADAGLSPITQEARSTGPLCSAA